MPIYFRNHKASLSQADAGSEIPNHQTKILHVAYDLREGGAERLLCDFARSLPEQNLTPLFYIYGNDHIDGIGNDILALNHPIYCYKNRGGWDLDVLANLIRIIKTHKISIVHTHDFGAMTNCFPLKVLMPHVKLLHTEHSLNLWIGRKKYRRLFEAASYFYHQIICVSEHVRQEVKRLCPRARHNLAVIYNGVDVAHFAKFKGLPLTSQLRILCVSRISTEKNLIHTLKALAQLHKANPLIDFTFTHVGSGDAHLKSELDRFIKQEQLCSRVKFEGFKKDIGPYLADHNIFISSSTTEGHPVAILEALASGMMVLCSDIPAHRMLGSTSLRYFSLDPASTNTHPNLCDVLTSIHNRPDDFAAIGCQAQKDVERHFSQQQMMNQYGAVYRKFS